MCWTILSASFCLACYTLQLSGSNLTRITILCYVFYYYYWVKYVQSNWQQNSERSPCSKLIRILVVCSCSFFWFGKVPLLCWICLYSTSTAFRVFLFSAPRQSLEKSEMKRMRFYQGRTMRWETNFKRKQTKNVLGVGLQLYEIFTVQ